uniref:Cystathionine gamma-synthase n=1 Tax=Cyanothece sp. (strain PCC 7425 / ATCC 29141) TaxID=395961 RepID=B8HMM9_CYAP4
MQIETLVVHGGGEVDPATGAIIPPIHLSTTFERQADGSYPHGYIYTRSGNPNRTALENCLAALEGGAGAITFASGAAATMSLFHCLSPGDQVIVPRQMYHGTTQLLRNIFIPWGLTVAVVEMTDLAQVEQALQTRTKLIWVETPSNPLLQITDIARVAAIAHQANALCVCDNTWATPLLQHPLDLGADWVIHASTKYLGGHSDVLGGVAIAKQTDDFYQRVRHYQITGGAVPSPFDCWLLLRGIRTLACRMRTHCENAAQIATFLSHHPQVEAVHYPGLPSHPDHALAQQQMTQFGGMVSFQVKGKGEKAKAVAAQVQLFTRATSLGGMESLIEHRASIEGPGTETPDNLLRLSLGLEHPQDLIADLGQALDSAFA